MQARPHLRLGTSWRAVDPICHKACVCTYTDRIGCPPIPNFESCYARNLIAGTFFPVQKFFWWGEGDTSPRSRSCPASSVGCVACSFQAPSQLQKNFTATSQQLRRNFTRTSLPLHANFTRTSQTSRRFTITKPVTKLRRYLATLGG